MERLKVSARRRIEARTKRGDASKFIKPASSLEPGDRVVILARRSKGQQKTSADEQAVYYRAKAEDAGLVVVDDVRITASGYDPWNFISAIQLARKLNATLLTATPNRFLRNIHFRRCGARSENFQATDEQWQELEWLADGVPLATFTEPDATANAERSEHARRSRTMKLIKRKLVENEFGKGISNRAISRQMGIPESTIRRWRGLWQNQGAPFFKTNGHQFNEKRLKNQGETGGQTGQGG